MLSSTEARCRTSAGVVGLVGVSVSTSWDVDSSFEGVWVESGLQYQLMDEVSVSAVQPSMLSAVGGTTVSVTVLPRGPQDPTSMWCLMGGDTVVKARSVSSGVVECMSAASVSGNITVEVSVNGQDWSNSMMSTEVVSVANASSVTPSMIGVAGGSIVSVSGSGLSAGVTTYCALTPPQ